MGGGHIRSTLAGLASYFLGGAAISSNFYLPTAPLFGEAGRGKFPRFGSARRTVAQDRRAAAKRRAVKRARKLGHA